MTSSEVPEHQKSNGSPPLLSIIIPTRNRQECAASAVRCVLAIPSTEIEVVVQDCSDDDLLSSLIASELPDKRLSYRYDRPPVTMTENWNRAIARSKGEYVCLIGDDDGINPEILQAAAWAKSKALDCLAVRNTVLYLWPGIGAPSAFIKDTEGGSLKIHGFQSDVTEADTAVELRKLLRDGGAYYLKFRLPKLYHGIVRRRCLEAVREKAGSYCGGLSPDIFPSLAIACLVDRLAVTDYPLTIPGVCKTSNSNVVSILKRFSTTVEDDADFRGSGGYRWSEVVPYVYTVETVWADSAVAALGAMGRDDLILQLNLPRLAAICIFSNPAVTWRVLRGFLKGLRLARKNRTVGTIAFVWNLVAVSGRNLGGRMKNRLLIAIGIRSGPDRIEGLSNIVEASQALTGYLKDNGWKFLQCAEDNDESKAPILTRS